MIYVDFPAVELDAWVFSGRCAAALVAKCNVLLTFKVGLYQTYWALSISRPKSKKCFNSLKIKIALTLPGNNLLRGKQR